MGYLETAREFYREAAETPDRGLCCTTTPLWTLPELTVPDSMLVMNYGCGTTVHPRDLAGEPTVLYVGVGGGMELLQFAHFSRRPGAVIGIEPVAEMREAAARNLAEAARVNDWFREEFVSLREGDAFALGVADGSVDVAAQNCLFNIFEETELRRALAEMHRVLRPHGRFVLSDPVAPFELPEHLRRDERLRAMCLSGAITYERYLELLTGAGFGTIEIRARRPYRILDPVRYDVDEPILLHSLEVAAIKDPIPPDGVCVFTGRTAVYYGEHEVFDDGAGHLMQRDMPLSVCDKTAATLESLGRDDLIVTPSTWFYDGGGCC
ncbi:MAG: arsenosugar biosynthesis arsenite methyltransferase ArsM [Acidobacteriota bacterium]|nr:arsenosugar biosynthesis arsenite methyltransferase ArsM [Acidobacteriota bacterium]